MISLLVSSFDFDTRKTSLKTKLFVCIFLDDTCHLFESLHLVLLIGFIDVQN